MNDYQPHPAAELFPLMDGAEFEALVEDIREHGLREAIVLHEGMILDGRNRYRACREAEVVCRRVKWDGEGSIENFIISKNLHRRHLTTSQRSMIGARLANMRQGARTDLEPSANLPNVLQDIETSQEQAAELLKVSTRSVRSAKVVIDSDDGELIQAVETGSMSLGSAAKQVREHDKQIDDLAPKKRRKRKKPTAASNAARAATLRRNGALARQLYDGLDKITGLPDIETMIKVTNKKHDFLIAKVPIAINWLNDFSHALSERNETDGDKRGEVEGLQGIQEKTQPQDGVFDAGGGDKAA